MRRVDATLWQEASFGRHPLIGATGADQVRHAFVRLGSSVGYVMIGDRGMAAPTMNVDPTDRLARRYSVFAEKEARERCPLYDELALGVARDRPTLQFLATLPAAKQQPNLLFAAVRSVCGTPHGWQDFRRRLHDHRDQIAAVMMSRSTQTNEPARCAILLPVLASLPQPLALIEVGASAGLCLIPDRYAYHYGGHRVLPRSSGSGEPPVFRCVANPDTPLPKECPEVVWRAGLDLNPIDVNDVEQVRWLETLVWPGEEDRLTNLRAARNAAREDPPRVIAGDLRTDLPALAAQSPAAATLVVFHTAVLAYVPRTDRLRFYETMRELDAVWVCNETPEIVSDFVATSRQPPSSGSFLLSADRQPVAWTDPHGRSIEWIG
jgi:hypothetical protein